MKRSVLIAFSAVLAGLWLAPGEVWATASPDVIITEVQTASTNSASEEFIELYNNTDNDIDFGSSTRPWKVQYFSSTKVTQLGFSWDATLPTGTISLTGKILAHDYYLLSTSNNGVTYAPGSIDPDQTYASAHLADAGGGVQLIDVVGTTTTQHDHVGWSNTIPLLPGLMVTPMAGGSLQRTGNASGSYTDESDNLLPFVPSNTITPKTIWQPAPEPEDTQQQTSSADGTSTQIDDTSTGADQINSSSSTTLRITELLPNPASPATDANDEFVEIYNYGDEPVDLAGFTLQTGSTYGYSYTIPDGTLEPHSYRAFTSGETPLALANSGGKARLLNQGGEVVFETTAYGEAAEGESWVLIDNTWEWTSSPTPGLANVLAVPIAAAKAQAKKAAATKTSKSTTAKKAAVKKASSSKTGSGQTLANDTSAQDDQAPILHPSILVGIGGAALLYGMYEYRTDVANRFYQFRKYREARRAARTAAKGA